MTTTGRESGYALGREAIRQMREIARRVLRDYRNAAPATSRPQPVQQKLWGKLDGNLNAATDFASAPGSATLSIWRRNAAGNMVDSGENITIYMRFENYGTVPAGTIVHAEWLAGEWHFAGADCEAA